MLISFFSFHNKVDGLQLCGIDTAHLAIIFKENIRGWVMEDIWRKAKHFGLGVLDFTREKVEALVSEMVKRG